MEQGSDDAQTCIASVKLLRVFPGHSQLTLLHIEIKETCPQKEVDVLNMGSHVSKAMRRSRGPAFLTFQQIIMQYLQDMRYNLHAAKFNQPLPTKMSQHFHYVPLGSAAVVKQFIITWSPAGHSQEKLMGAGCASKQQQKRHHREGMKVENSSTGECIPRQYYSTSLVRHASGL